MPTPPRPLPSSLLAAALVFLGCAPPEAPEGVGTDVPAATSDWSATAQAGIAAGEYAPEADGATFRVTNRAQDLRGTFSERGLAVTSRAGTGEVTLSLRAWGREDALSAVDPTPPEEGACLSGGAVDAFGECLRRVEYARTGLVEWWENRPAGLEQGFTVTAPPDGNGALVFELALAGALADVDEDEALLVREAGDPLRFGSLAAWDERGRALPAWMEETDAGLRLVVDDTGAIGTITVDPLLTTAAWTAEPDQTGASFGGSVASAGDVNGDGFGDVVVGAYRYDNGSTDEGRAFVYLGSATGLATSAAWTAESDQASAYFGFAVASAGDVNGDGYGDVVIGAHLYDNGSANEGRAYVYLGSASGLATSAAWTAESNQTSAYFGVSVAAAGDVNGDGYGDVVVGAHEYTGGSSDEGRASVYLGSASGLSTSAAWTAEPDQAAARFGRSVASAGDVNGDGYGDVVVGAYMYTNGSTDEGAAFVYLGSSSGLSTSAAWTAESDQAFASFGVSVASAGDVNGDGYGDVVVGAYEYDNGETDEGRAYVYLGSSSGLATSAAWTAESDQASASFGRSVGSAGDVNGDGYGDVVVGVYLYDNGETDEGAAFVYLGSASGLATSTAWTAESDQASAYFGFAVASAGDVNGDGYGDVVVGAHLYDNGSTDEGEATVHLGSASGLATSTAWTAESDQDSANFAYSVASAGDVNGDGYGDVVVGAPYYDNGSTDEGAAFLYLGSSSGLAASAAWTAESDQASAYFGYSLGSAGDVNGDGYSDVVVGAFSYDNGESAEGRAFVYLGSSSGLATSAAWTAESDQASAYFGYSVGSAGDVNGDGYGDVVVGASTYTNGSSYEGAAFVYLGSASGLTMSAAWTAESGQASASFGQSVASAGDVNGDGFGDVVVGAPHYNNGSTDEGRAFVYLGSSSGLATSAAWTAESNQASAYFGAAVASAGDVNGDGYGDVVVGAYRYDNGSTNEGRAYVYLGSVSGLATSAAWTAESDQASAYFGNAVASAGDVNGDGFGDVVVGADGYDNGSTDEGRAYVYLGSASGLATSAAWTAESDQASAALGHSVASAGDVNGDGFGDVVVGAYAYDNGSTNEGRAFLYLGNGEDGTTPLAAAGQARQSRATTPIVAGLASTSTDTFDVAMGTARTSWGYGQVKLQVEVKALGAAFDGTDLVTSSSFSSSGLGGADIQEAIPGLTGSTGYHWRARVLASAAEGRPQGWGRWVYGGRSGDSVGGHVFTAGTTYYADGDGDGYGDASVAMSTRAVPSGYVTDATDCDDTAAAVNPGATELCDALDIDEDCDGLADDDDASATGPSTFYADTDGDGYGGASAAYCDLPSGYVTTSTDCDDSDAAVNPGASELCDASNTDEDCDGLADDDDASATGQSTFYADTDGDGYGGASATHCDLPSGYVVTSTDCDDTNAAIHPAATELCDASDTDEDCDGLADDDDASATGQSTFYADTDGDGYGGASTAYCDLPSGHVVTSTDCDDTDAAIHPAATELCDVSDTDEDCDGLADDDDASATGQSTFYADTDGDGYGGASATHCDLPSGYVVTSTDCDDTNAAIHPAATELCDASDTDEDCDGLADDDDASATGQSTFYADTDGDGYGGASASYCDLPTGHVVTSTDCDDSSDAIHPAAAEIAGDEVDQDCDGAESCYVDTDQDGARTAFVVASADVECTAPGEALASADLDCDDADPDAWPGATELTGSGVDEDCDGEELCYVDADDDTYRPDATSTVASTDADCSDPGEALASALDGDCDDTSAAYNPGAVEADCTDPTDYNCDGSTAYANVDGDAYAACEECDDTDAAVYPGAAELPGDGIDGDCDGVDLCYEDADADGYRTDATIAGSTVACDGPGEAVVDASIDCDDADATVSPAAVEAVGDEVDSDCDGFESCYTDADADGYRSEDGAVVLSDDTDCADSDEARASAGTDCDDTTAATHPAATELAGDGIDSDCDGVDDCYADADADGYRTEVSFTGTTLACDGPGEAAAATGVDCDDTDASVNPEGAELAGDGLDSDCDGTEVCYSDADGDGYTDGAEVESADADCADAGEATATALTGDCDDGDIAYNPGASETNCADPNDYNCDGSAGYVDADADGWAACEECDDADGGVNPDATERAGDQVDQDCDGVELCFVDADDDGSRPDAASTVDSTNVACDGAGEAVATDPADDCDDAAAAIHAGATELAGDEVDQDCDGTELCLVDADGDGYTPDGGATLASADLSCRDAGEATASAASGDCDDADAAYNPGALEDDCADPADYNCDGSSGVVDGDGDGFFACEDCDDGAGDVNPDADEVCNGVDDDCDGSVDVDAIDAETWYADADGDGYTGLESLTACDAPDGYAAATEDDCDDADATAYPGGDEVPGDGIDQDCDGIDAVGEGPNDTGHPGHGKDEEGCGCAAAGSAGPTAWMFGALALLVARRRGISVAPITRAGPA